MGCVMKMYRDWQVSAKTVNKNISNAVYSYPVTMIF
jgi:hypothetical protein